MKKVLMLLAHSNFDNSLSNKIISEYVGASPDVTVRNLSDVSEDFNFDIEAEQAALIEAETIVLQFPFHWYSMPAIMKKWFDDVLAFGFAYGPGGDKLHGKRVIISLTTGGPAEAYTVDGANNYTVSQLVAPILESAKFCGMEVAETIASCGMLYIPDVMGDKDEVSKRAKEHAEKLGKLIANL